MAIKSKKVVRKVSSRREESKNNNRNDNDRDRDNDRGRDSGNDGSEFINLTKLFETKKNPDNLVGTCKPDKLADLSALIESDEAQANGLAFFVFLQGKWGPSLSVTVGRERQESSFNDGGRESRSRSQRSGSRNNRW